MLSYECLCLEIWVVCLWGYEKDVLLSGSGFCVEIDCWYGVLCIAINKSYFSLPTWI